MENRILDVEVHDHSLDPAAAELRVVVRIASPVPAVELRGRLMGPSCAFSSTVEIAYPLRPVAVPGTARAEEHAAGVLIPEPSLWDPQSPFLYGGPIELWVDGRRCDSVRVRHGLRRLQVRPGEVRVNGRPLALRGTELTAPCSDEEALQLRRAGCNLIVAPVAQATAPLWDVGDRLGFLVVGRLAGVDDETPGRLAGLRRHACCLGWLADDPKISVAGRLPAGIPGFPATDR